MMQTFSDRYPVWFCDIWGVVHNGVAPFPITVAALKRHRAKGGTVILVTNSPRSNLGVEKQLLEIGVDPVSHDRIVTSGDVTQVLMKLHGGRGVYHVGAARDLSIYEGTGVERVDLDAADAVLGFVTGFREQVGDLMADPAELTRLMGKGADKARAAARPTLQTVYERVGFVPLP